MLTKSFLKGDLSQMFSFRVGSGSGSGFSLGSGPVIFLGSDPDFLLFSNSGLSLGPNPDPVDINPDL